MKIYPLSFTGICEMTGERFPAAVPGNIQKDFAGFKNFGDMNYADNPKKLEPYEDTAWRYEAAFLTPNEKEERLLFVTGGIDYFSEVYLNGEKLFSHEGSYEPYSVDLTEKAKREGENLLAVRILPHPKRKGAPKGRDEADHSCKAPACYEWDWHPRLLSSGIWNGAHLETRRLDKLTPAVRYSLNSDLTEAEVSLSANIDCVFTLLDRDGKKVYEGKAGKFTLTNPHLWWPNGEGESYLYHWICKNEEESVEGNLGFRRVRLVMNAGEWEREISFPKTRNNPPAQLEINGKPIFAKGSNVVNLDLFQGTVTPEYTETIVKAAKDANMNVFRMWGGTGMQKEVFYDLCDRYGIMVWYEFPLACNCYPDDDHYLAILEQEARAMLRILVHHPSLTLLCGGNELFNNWSGMTDQSLPLRLLGKLCYEEARDIPFNMTSPLGGMAHGCYLFRWNGKEVYGLMQEASNTAYTEFGIPGTPSADTLRKYLPSADAMNFDEPIWTYRHALKAWREESWLCPSLLADYFGKINDLDTLVEKSQWMQSEGYKAIFEEARRQQPYCAMSINWCFNEPWLCAANNTLLAFPAEKKPAYYAVKNSLSAVVPSAKITKFSYLGGEPISAELWLLNQSDACVEDKIDVTIELGGEVYPVMTWNTGKSERRSNIRGHAFYFVLPDGVDADRLTVRLKGGLGENDYTLVYRPKKAPVKPEKKILNL